MDGNPVGNEVGIEVGENVGDAVVGDEVGMFVGNAVGNKVGLTDGRTDGAIVGFKKQNEGHLAGQKFPSTAFGLLPAGQWCKALPPQERR